MERKAYLNEVNDYCESNLKLNEEDRDNWFEDILNRLEVRTNTIFPDYIFYCIDKIVYLRLDLKSRDLWCSPSRTWSILEKEFGMQYDDIQKFIKDRVEVVLKIGVVIPYMYKLNN